MVPRPPRLVGAAQALTPPFAENGRVGRHRRAKTTFRLLFVCTGNICRSPVAEILTRHMLIGALGGRSASAFRIASAGVQAVVGAPVHPRMLTELAPLGLDREGERFIARQFVPELVESTDLVLGAGPQPSLDDGRTGACRAAHHVRPPRIRPAGGIRRCIGAARAPVARAHALVERARIGAAWFHRCSPEDNLIPDPINGPQTAHHAAVELISAAITTIVKIVIPAER